MHMNAYDPAFVLCSTAKRAEQTLTLLLPHIAEPDKIQHDRALYLAEWPQLLAEIHAVPGRVSPLLLVGHNPGLEQLAIALALQPRNSADGARTERLAEKFPTAALAVLDFSGSDWSDIKPGSGRLVDYMRPKDLAGQSETE